MKQPFNYAGLLIALIVGMSGAVTESARQGKNSPSDLCTAAILGGVLATTAFIIPPRVPGAPSSISDALQQVLDAVLHKNGDAGAVVSTPISRERESVAAVVAPVLPAQNTASPVATAPRVPLPADATTPAPVLSPQSEAIAQRVAEIIQSGMQGAAQ